MALPKVLTRIEEKLDRVLEMLEQQPAPPPYQPTNVALALCRKTVPCFPT